MSKTRISRLTVPVHSVCSFNPSDFPAFAFFSKIHEFHGRIAGLRPEPQLGIIYVDIDFSAQSDAAGFVEFWIDDPGVDAIALAKRAGSSKEGVCLS